MAFALAPAVGFAQADLRSSFPGGRVGGGTRGECSARLLAHLVTENSIYAPGRTLQVGLLEGPTATLNRFKYSFVDGATPLVIRCLGKCSPLVNCRLPQQGLL